MGDDLRRETMSPVEVPGVKNRLRDELFRLMASSDAPAESMARMRESLGA